MWFAKGTIDNSRQYQLCIRIQLSSLRAMTTTLSHSSHLIAFTSSNLLDMNTGHIATQITCMTFTAQKKNIYALVHLCNTKRFDRS